jgi:hypothetical protein
MESRWLPFAYAIATAITLLLASGAPDRRRWLASHFWIYLAVPATRALAIFGFDLEPSVAGAPYVAVVAVIAWRGMAAIWGSRALCPDRAIGRRLGLVALATMLALLPYERTVQPTQSDEPHYLLIMESIVQDHDLDLRNDYDRADYADYYPDILPDRHVIISGESQLPIRDLGLPLLGALPFAIARRTGVLVLMCLVGAAIAWRGFALLRTLRFSRDSALLAAAAVAFLHPVFTYSTQIYPDLPAALVVLLVAELLARPPTIRRFAGASALLGLLPWLTIRGWFPVVGLGLVVAYLALRPLAAGFTRSRVLAVAAAALPFAALVVALSLVDLRLFGMFVPNAGYLLIRDAQPVLVYTPQLGIPGLFLDRTFGLLSRAPLYALAFFGAVPLLRHARATRSPAIVALFLGWLAYLLYIGDIAYWWADGSPSSRYLLATIAFPMVALAAGLDRVRGDLGRAAVATAAGWTAAITAIFALMPNLRYDLASDVRDGAPGQLWVYLTKILRVDLALLFPSLVRAAPIDAVVTLAWAALLGALVVLGARRPAAPVIPPDGPSMAM